MPVYKLIYERINGLAYFSL